MTREEAIEEIQGIIDSEYYDHPDTIKALYMAIKALSQEPNGYVNIAKDLIDDEEDSIFYQEPCEDAISREWLMRKATERFYTTNYFNHISAMIEEAPSVTQKSETVTEFADRCRECGKRYVKRQTGHWNTYENYQGGIKETWYECSECKWSSALLIPRKYCPNCGEKKKG